MALSRETERLIKDKQRSMRRLLDQWMKNNGLEGKYTYTFRLYLKPIPVEGRPAYEPGLDTASLPAEEVLTAEILRLAKGRTQKARVKFDRAIAGLKEYFKKHGQMTTLRFVQEAKAGKLVELPQFGKAQMQVVNQALANLGYAPITESRPHRKVPY